MAWGGGRDLEGREHDIIGCVMREENNPKRAHVVLKTVSDANSNTLQGSLKKKGCLRDYITLRERERETHIPLGNSENLERARAVSSYCRGSGVNSVNTCIYIIDGCGLAGNAA